MLRASAWRERHLASGVYEGRRPQAKAAGATCRAGGGLALAVADAWWLVDWKRETTTRYFGGKGNSTRPRARRAQPSVVAAAAAEPAGGLGTGALPGRVLVRSRLFVWVK